MKFEEALRLLRDGHRVQRAAWQGREQLRLVYWEAPPYLQMLIGPERGLPWGGSQIDVLADDWRDLGNGGIPADQSNRVVDAAPMGTAAGGAGVSEGARLAGEVADVVQRLATAERTLAAIARASGCDVDDLETSATLLRSHDQDVERALARLRIARPKR